MWYLSRSNSNKIKRLSLELIAQNGWADQFIVTKKVLNQYSAAIDNVSTNGLHKVGKLYLIKNIVDALIVAQHLVNQLKIHPGEFEKIAFREHIVHGEIKEPKILRNYRRVLCREYKLPPVPNLQKELSRMSALIMDKEMKSLGEARGKQFELCIASEEAGELAKEISKYYRFAIVNDEKGMADVRETLIEELYDMLYTMRYPIMIAKITEKELDNYADLRVPEIRAREITYKHA